MFFQNKLYSRDVFIFLKKESLFDSNYFFRNRYKKIILFWIDRFSKNRIFSNIYPDIPDTFMINLISGSILGNFPEIYENYMYKYCNHHFYNSFFLGSTILAQNTELIDRMPQDNFLSLRISSISKCYYLMNYYLSLLPELDIRISIEMYKDHDAIKGLIDNNIIKYLEEYYKKL